jgi:hypothetical protein
MEKVKYCNLTVHLKSGVTITGKYHVRANIDQLVRPSDAILANRNVFLVLGDAIIRDGEDAHQRESMMVCTSEIAYIELPSTNWVAAEGAAIQGSLGH